VQFFESDRHSKLKKTHRHIETSPHKQNKKIEVAVHIFAESKKKKRELANWNENAICIHM
jgi:hypothetical protein